MLTENASDRPGTGAAARAFWWRLTDNLFRHAIWFLLPVVVLTAVGFMQARKTLELYESTGTLSASNNPFVPEQEIAGTTAQLWESPSRAMSRIINERLGTDAFARTVADSAGLGPSIDEGVIDLGYIASSVWAGPVGDSLLEVNALWGDPQTSQALAAATIAEFQNFLDQTVASDATEAEQFYTALLEEHTAERDRALLELEDYLAALPNLEEDDEYPIRTRLQIERLNAALDAAEGKIAEAEDAIESAKLMQSQQTSEAGRSLTEVDPPDLATAPESTLMERARTVVSYAVLGAIIGLAALLITTVLDSRVTSTADLLSIGGVVLVATVPPLAQIAESPRRRRRPRGRRRGRA